MYKISAKPGFNILLKDLNINLNCTSGNSINLTKEQLNDSKDILKSKNFLNIEEIDIIEEKHNNEINHNILDLGNNSFVRDGNNSFSAIDNVFIRSEEKEQTIEESKNETIEEKIDIINVKENIFIHDGNNSFSEPSEEKGEFITKPAKKPGRKKKGSN